MNWADLNERHYQAFCVASFIGSNEALKMMRDLVREAIETGMSVEIFASRIAKTAPFELLERADQAISDAIKQAHFRGHQYPAASAAIQAISDTSRFAFDQWGISDPLVSIRIINYVALQKAYPGDLLAATFCSISPEDLRGKSVNSLANAAERRRNGQLSRLKARVRQTHCETQTSSDQSFDESPDQQTPGDAEDAPGDKQ